MIIIWSIRRYYTTMDFLFSLLIKFHSLYALTKKRTFVKRYLYIMYLGKIKLILLSQTEKIGSIGNNFYALYFCASCICISIVRRHFLLQKWMISRFPYLLKMFTSSVFGHIISSQVTVLRQWVLEKQDYIIMSYITQFSHIWKWVSNVRKWITHIKKWHLLKKNFLIHVY